MTVNTDDNIPENTKTMKPFSHDRANVDLEKGINHGSTAAKPMTSVSQRKSRVFLLTLIAIVAVPFLLATLMYQFQLFVPTGRTNHGELILPPKQIINLQLNGAAALGSKDRKWSLFYIAEENCLENCLNRLYLMRQVHTALGKESGRMSTHLITRKFTPDDKFLQQLKLQFPNMTLNSIDPLNRELSDLKQLSEHQIFLADPNGNIMMYFSEQLSGKLILTDLKKLLRLSNIG